MDEDGPNFSYAFGGAANQSDPSWNPALRPDHGYDPESEKIPTPVAQQLQPSPQIIPQSKPELEESVDGEDELPIISAASPIPAHRPNGSSAREPGFKDDLIVSNGAGHAPGSMSDPLESETNGHEVDGPGEEGHVSAAEPMNPWEEGLGHAPANANGLFDESHQMRQHEGAASASSSDEDPAELYEHQGETTLLEDAVTESAKVPLMTDVEGTPDDWATSGEVFDLGGMPQDAPLESPLETPFEIPQADAAGTTVGDAFIATTTVGGNAGDGIDWGNEDGDDFFGGAASQPVEPPQPSDQDQAPGAHVVQKPDTNLTAVTDSTWDLALDDEFLPDAEETPAFELDDDEGFLDDEPAGITLAAPSTTSRYAPQNAQTAHPSANAYGLQGPQFASLSQPDQTKATVTPTPSYVAYGQSSPYQQQPLRPPMPSSSQSFADKAKGGYHSPYDLPDDVVTTTRRRPATRTTTTPAAQVAPPPPRTSSITSAGANRPPLSATLSSPPSSGHSMQSMTGLPPNAPPKPAAPARSPSSDFFAELPVTSKPKTSGRYAPQHSTSQHPPTPGFASKERTASWSSLRNEVLPDSGNVMPDLRQPERLPVFPDHPTAPVRTNSLPVPPAQAPPSNRYSPAPQPSAPGSNAQFSPVPPPAPAANSRYSPAPPQASAQNHSASAPPTGPPRGPTQPYAPRTSSPLAFHTSPQQQQGPLAAQEPSAHHAMHSAEGILRGPFRTPLEGVSETEEQTAAQSTGFPMVPRSATPPSRSNPASAVSSPMKRGNYAPQYQSPQAAPPSGVAPPARAQSQSPSAFTKPGLRTIPFNDRPASAHGFGAIQSTFGGQVAAAKVNVIPHRRQASLEYGYIAPTDERAADPLERWRGAPIFTWGLGGAVVTTFPKQVPRYGGGATMPMMKCSPGEVRIQSIKEALPLSEDIAKFPGPLKAKNKKKDISSWLGRRVEAMETELATPSLDHSLDADAAKRRDEKILLWKVLQVFVDHDGQLSGNTTVEAAVRKVLSPESDSFNGAEPSFSTPADLVGLSRSNTSAVQADPVEPRAVEELRTLLTKGDREKAVWHAVDQRLWAHAMLLSSTLNKEVWKQVVQEFVKKEVKKMGRDNQALAVLYEIFAGNHEDCIDELVPASARAGFQMMSTDGAGSAQDALQGLDKWRETLSLVLNNRSDGDAAALASLGRLLAGYGRVEAAHICFIFARAVTSIGGVDDVQSDVVLLGVDHRKSSLDLGVDLEPVLLTEVYEFGLSLSAHGGSYIIPHLQSYKLAHAYQLAEYGQRNDAQAYCDAIAAAMKATTRISPYYNGSFVARLDDLSKRLSQSPKDGSSSWISKPSMDKVSSSLLSKFNSFIAGDDEDAASNNTPAGELGPFARIAGNTPNLSPAQSSADIYGAYAGNVTPAAPPTNSRYAPSNAHAPRTSSESTRSKYDPQTRPSLEFTDSATGLRAVSESYMPSSSLSSPYTPSQSQLSPAHPQLSKSQSYSPLRTEHNVSQPAYGELAPAFGGFQPSGSFDDTPAESRQASSAYDPSSTSYEPPTSSYEPPSYQPYQPDADDEAEEDSKPEKTSFMDDDDDAPTRAASIQTKGKSDSDRKADEAFRKAAEEDANRDAAAAGKKGGWFGGWFKKDPNAAPGPIKAKLGEESSFYYDPELKKWVNKKGGVTEASKPMATPPPPKSGPPTRSVSNNSPMGPPSSLPSSNHLSAPPSRAPTSNPLRSSSMPPPASLPGSRASTPGLPSDNEGPRPPVLTRPTFPSGTGPPSRPGTGMSTASSIDDLLGAPQARKGPGAKKKKAGRYVDVMAQQ